MVPLPSQSNLKELYEIDDYLWIEKTIKLLKEKKFNDLGIENLIEELEDLGTERKNKVESLLRQIIIHLLLLEYWSKEYQYNAAHWKAEITEFRFQLKGILTKNLQHYLEIGQLLDEDWFSLSDLENA